MVITITDKQVTVPSLSVFRYDSKIDTLNFKMDRFYKETDLSEYDVFLKTLRADGFSDKIKLEKTVDENELTFSWEINSNDTLVEGELKAQISLELGDESIMNTKVFTLNVNDSISGYEGIDDGYFESAPLFAEFAKKRFVDDIVTRVDEKITEFGVEVATMNEKVALAETKMTNVDASIAVFREEIANMSRTVDEAERIASSAEETVSGFDGRITSAQENAFTANQKATENERAITTLATDVDVRITEITEKISQNASSENPLADKNYVDQKIDAENDFNILNCGEVVKKNYYLTQDVYYVEEKTYYTHEIAEGLDYYKPFDATNAVVGQTSVEGLYEATDVTSVGYTLENNKRYALSSSINQTITFGFPTVTDVTKFNEVYAQIYFANEVTVNWDDVIFVNKTAPIFDAGCYYEIIATYIVSAKKWSVGVIKSGVADDNA